MELLDIRCIAEAADAGNLSQAAKALGLETSSVSRRIVRVEDSLGVTLFERTRKGVRVTAVGEAVLIHVKRALAEVNAIAAVARERASGSIGELRLGVSTPPVGGQIRDLLQNWRTAHPELTLTIVEGSRRELATALKDHRIDTVLFPTPSHWPQVGSLPLFRERLFAAVPASHALADASAVEWDSLAKETILVQGWNDAHTQREFYATLLGSGAHFQTHPASRMSLFALIATGAGITLVPQGQAEASIPGVVFRPIDENNAWLDFGLVWLAETEDPVVGRFIAFMRDRARNTPAASPA